MPKAIEDSLDLIPVELQPYYTEKNGKYELTGIEGLRTDADIQRLQSALQKERNDHSQVKQVLKAFGDLTPESVREQLDRIPELELAASGKVDEAGIEKIVETRLRTKLTPLERKMQEIATERDNYVAQLQMYQSKDKIRTIQDSIRALTIGETAKIKVLPEATEDIMMYAERVLEINEDGQVCTRDNVGVVPGLPVEVWLSEMVSKKPHWAGATVGGGASGSGRGAGATGPNPFSKEGWNMTEQGRLIKADRKKAEQMARAAGTSIGGARPA